jgi:hypothetical protein
MMPQPLHLLVIMFYGGGNMSERLSYSAIIKQKDKNFTRLHIQLLDKIANNIAKVKADEVSLCSIGTCELQDP